VDEQRVIVSAGQSLIVPSGRKHGFRNSGTAKLHIHAVLASPFSKHDGRRCGSGAAMELA
jgi:mannose-6-phosphate isomerase-like protein (cupin superfamily)